MLTALAQAGALVGGALLLVAVGVTCASVLRGAFGRPILGDSEIVEMSPRRRRRAVPALGGDARRHVIVDVFTARLPARGIAWLDAAMRAARGAGRDGAGRADHRRRLRAVGPRTRDHVPRDCRTGGAMRVRRVGLALWTVTAAFVAVERFQDARRPA